MSDNDGGNSDGVPAVEIIVDDVERIDRRGNYQQR